jgi:hypothetical protein
LSFFSSSFVSEEPVSAPPQTPSSFTTATVLTPEILLTEYNHLVAYQQTLTQYQQQHFTPEQIQPHLNYYNQLLAQYNAHQQQYQQQQQQTQQQQSPSTSSSTLSAPSTSTSDRSPSPSSADDQQKK